MAREAQLWPALRRYWHLVAFTTDVADRPVPAAVLGARLALVRLDGAVSCFRDLCIHRGTPISFAWVEEGRVVCAYHGWSYDASGACTRIPALPEGRAIPARARLERFRAVERYGLVWVCLGDPCCDVPEFPEYDDPAFKCTFYPPTVWSASAARHTENTVDAAHFPWVHERILGERSHPRVPEFPIERRGEELRFEYEDLPNPMHPMRHRRVYRFHRPFTIHQRKVRANGEVEASFSTVNPREAGASTGFLIVARNFPLTEEEERERFELDCLIIQQDRTIVERQRPHEVPLDLREELQIRGSDAVAIAYRRFMAELGVEIDGAS